jgi:threonine dehydratase
VPDGKVSTTILKLYEQGIPVEPAGALSVSCLDTMREEIRDKNVVCIISGATVDLSRFDEFKEFSLLYEGLKYFLLLNLP